MIGKWHLGFGQASELPTGRGFETYLGYWNGAEDYITHEVGAYDFADGTRTAYEYAGQYSTNVFTNRAIEIIDKAGEDFRSKSNASPTPNDAPPWYIYLCYQAVHWPLEAPDEWVSRFQVNKVTRLWI
jgi:arylsulfatase A-like enzyme